MKWSLQSIGVPLVYRAMNPFAFNRAQRLDSFPELGNLKCVAEWTQQQGNMQSSPQIAWQRYVSQYLTDCAHLGRRAFVLDRDRRNQDEHVRSFLARRRKHVRDYVDPLGLASLPFFRTSHYYRRRENSWWLRSQGRIIRPIKGFAIGKLLHDNHHWTRTHCPEYRGMQSWNRWIQYATTRIGWSTTNHESWFWYEIHCPQLPGIAGNIRNLDAAAFDRHMDEIWLPLVKNLRWYSTSQPRTWSF